MADGSFCDYAGQLDSNLMSHLAGYGARTSSENLGKYFSPFNLCPSSFAVTMGYFTYYIIGHNPFLAGF